MEKPFCSQKQRLRKVPLSLQRDEKLHNNIMKHGHGSWQSLPKLAGLQRSAKHRYGSWSSVLKPAVCVLLLSALVSLCLNLRLSRNSITPRVSQPSSYRHRHRQYQVFINFRGEELRYGFVSHLGEALERRGINFFIDKHEERGKDLMTLFTRIEDSAIALSIFSTRYAESRWCLDELVKIMELVEMGELRVIPIFFKVNPRDVRKQTGDFGEIFWRLARVSRGERIMKWKDALESVSSKMGLTLTEKSYENEFAKKIVKEVERVLTAIPTERIGNCSLYPMESKRRNAPISMLESVY